MLLLVLFYNKHQQKEEQFFVCTNCPSIKGVDAGGCMIGNSVRFKTGLTCVIKNAIICVTKNAKGKLSYENQYICQTRKII